MKNSKAPQKEEPPKKPLNAYMVFRKDKLEEYKNNPNKKKNLKDEWEIMDPKLKEQMNAQYKEEMKAWKIKMDQYVDKHGKPEHKRNSKKHKDEEPEKEKGRLRAREEPKKEDPEKKLPSKSQGKSKK